MSKFNPPLSSRTTEGLVLIANSSEDEWQVDAKNLAMTELRKRGIDTHKQTNIYKVLLRKRKEEEEIELANRAIEDYSLDEKFFIILRWPIYLFRDWGLKHQGYLLKSKNRIRLILFGAITTTLIFIWAYNSQAESDKQRLKEIEDVDISEWEENRIKK